MHYICVDPGTHLTGDVPRVDTHGESPGVPDSPPHWGFRDVYITHPNLERRDRKNGDFLLNHRLPVRRIPSLIYAAPHDQR